MAELVPAGNARNARRGRGQYRKRHAPSSSPGTDRTDAAPPSESPPREPPQEVHPISEQDSALLLRALNSCYDDQLRPLSHHIIRRVEELSRQQWTPARLQQVAAGTAGVTAERDPHRVWYYFKDRPGHFVDEKSLDDPYPADLWAELAQAVGDCVAGRPDGILARSRYTCTLQLRDLLPRLQQHTFGEVYHVVELAYRKHRILGYRDGCIVLYRDSEDHSKRTRAAALAASVELKYESQRFATWSDVRAGCIALLSDPKLANNCALSAVKAAFRTKFNLELDETKLGHTKLSSVFDDEHLADVCYLHAVGNDRQIRAVADRRSLGAGASDAGPSHIVAMALPRPTKHPHPLPTKRTFIHFSEHPDPRATSAGRGRSLSAGCSDSRAAPDDRRNEPV